MITFDPRHRNYKIHKPVIISILSMNGHLLADCLHHLTVANYESLVKYGICIVVQGIGTNNLLQVVEEYQDRYPKIIFPIYLKENIGFVRGNNLVIEKYPGADIIMINDDTWPTSDMVTELQAAAYINKRIAAVGGKILNMDGTLQECGAHINYHNEIWLRGTGWSPGHPRFSKIMKVAYTSGCMFYMKREAINKIGVLDDAFHPAYAEDADWSLRAHEAGMHVIVTPCAQLTHLGSITAKSLGGLRDIFERNLHTLFAKHGKMLRTDPFFRIERNYDS